MIHAHELERAFLAALIAQVDQPAVVDILQDATDLVSGYVPGTTVAIIADLILNRGIALTPQTARAAILRAMSANQDAVEWIQALDLETGARANLDKLARELHRLRAAQQAEGLLANIRVDPDTLDADLTETLSKLSEVLSKLSDERFRVGSLGHYLRKYVKGEAIIPPTHAVSIVRFGVQALDDLQEGIVASRGTLGIVAAPPTWGKSVVVSSIVANTSGAGFRVLAVSLEQSRDQVGMRAVASVTGDLKGHVANGGQPRQVADEAIWASDLVGIMAPGSGTPWFRIEAAARRAHRTTGLDVLIVDYFTLLEPPQLGRQFSSASMYGWISKAGKRLAQELGIAVVLIAQFNRGLGAYDEEPDFKDLKETSQLEQDGDWILFLWPPKKNLMLKPMGHEDNRVSCYRTAKNRWGKVQFMGHGAYLEIDTARDRLMPYVRETDAATPIAAGVTAHGF